MSRASVRTSSSMTSIGADFRGQRFVPDGDDLAYSHLVILLYKSGIGDSKSRSR